MRGKPELFADHYSQARLFWISQTPVEQNHIINAFRFELTRCQVVAVRKRVVALLANVDQRLATSVAEGLGMELPPPLPLATDAPTPTYTISPALSLFFHPGEVGIATRNIAILAGDGAIAESLEGIYAALLQDGAVPRIVGSRLGAITTADGNKIGSNSDLVKNDLKKKYVHQKPFQLYVSKRTATPIFFLHNASRTVQ